MGYRYLRVDDEISIKENFITTNRMVQVYFEIGNTKFGCGILLDCEKHSLIQFASVADVCIACGNCYYIFGSIIATISTRNTLSASRHQILEFY